jgi:hypothetical protein
MILKIKRRIAVRVAAVGVFLAAAAATAVVAQPASANIADCNSGGYLCMWVDTNYDGSSYLLNSDTPNLGWFNDKLSSFLNQSDVTWLAFEHADYGGACLYQIQPHESLHNVGDFGNDRVSSIRAKTDSDWNMFCQG